ncbi:MAG: flagellar protein export ATPase FliI [Alphaproteobacteria bacterium]|nr:MAG: flagellar protein export ATPase FliI [Alphaproteobacteria bacterium]
MTLQSYLDMLHDVSTTRFTGSVDAVRGLVITCKGLSSVLKIGDRCMIERRKHSPEDSGMLHAEVVGFHNETALLMPFDPIDGIGPGSKVVVQQAAPMVHPTHAWLGRVVNAFGEPLDGKGPLPKGAMPCPIRGCPPPAHLRDRVGGKMDMGVRAINTFLTTCKGQRLGIFAGSGVGKSILMSMLARYSQASVNVIGLIGERGREVQEFIEDDLGEEGLARSVVVVATSSESALMRREAAYMTMALAEYFSNASEHVLCLMDSVTRFAMAQREIGLSVGEPPTTKGYTPTVFSELPRLLERAGPGRKGTGSITGYFTVLVEGDDTNEPISDTVRGILDGHIIMDRKIAERGRYPAINILRSVSRTMPDCNIASENALVTMARGLLSTYEDMAEMIRLGAYRKGTDADVDRAIHYFQPLEKFLAQDRRDHTNIEQSYAKLADLLGIKPWPLPH